MGPVQRICVNNNCSSPGRLERFESSKGFVYTRAYGPVPVAVDRGRCRNELKCIANSDLTLFSECDTMYHTMYSTRSHVRTYFRKQWVVEVPSKAFFDLQICKEQAMFACLAW